MKAFGIILIVIGFTMFFVRSCSYTTVNNILTQREVEINREEKQDLEWPFYAGGIVALLGIVIFYSEKKKR